MAHSDRPASRPPYGAAVVVHRKRNGCHEFLVLHKSEHELDADGSWAWGPPSGGRHEREPVERCARRELLEETGLYLRPEPTGVDQGGWPYFLAEAPLGARVILSDEHDRFTWVPLGVAVRMCTPSHVAEAIEHVGRLAIRRGLGAA